MTDDLQKALNYSYFYLKFRPRSIKEMRDYLTKKAIRFGWTRETIDAAILSLTEERLLNDTQFIDWYVNQRSVNKPKSKYLFSRELDRFGISKDIIDQFFEKSPQDEDRAALKALRSRFSRWTTLDKHERFKKSAAFLQRRGFSYDQIKKAIAVLEDTV